MSVTFLTPSFVVLVVVDVTTLLQQKQLRLLLLPLPVLIFAEAHSTGEDMRGALSKCGF